MISKKAIIVVDRWLDDNVGPQYLDDYGYPNLAQDWARVCKVQEEEGESIAELILLTGQNPRKGEHPEARGRLLAELADRAFTAILAIQHFTKDADETETVLMDAEAKIYNRAIADQIARKSDA
jgi:hypothetical protein